MSADPPSNGQDNSRIAVHQQGRRPMKAPGRRTTTNRGPSQQPTCGRLQEPISSSVNPSSVFQSNTKASHLRNEHCTTTYVPSPNMATISAPDDLQKFMWKSSPRSIKPRTSAVGDRSDADPER
ncbi:hypothetical protein ACLOJK_014997 [Asimina triloba]